LDVLIALVILATGFAAVLSLNNAAALTQSRAENTLRAVNLAGSSMEEILDGLQADSGAALDLLSGMESRNGMFKRRVQAKWDPEGLLMVQVEVTWKEGGRDKSYVLHSLFDTAPPGDIAPAH